MNVLLLYYYNEIVPVFRVPINRQVSGVGIKAIGAGQITPLIQRVAGTSHSATAARSTSSVSAMRSRPTGLQLPQSLLDQLNETSGNRNTYVHPPILLNITLDATPTSRHSRSSLHKPKMSRKEARKQNREGKKRRKAEYFTSTGTSSKRLATSPHPDSPPPKKRTVAGQPWPQSSGRQSEKGLSEKSSRLTSKKTRAVTSSGTPSSRSVTHPTLPRSQQEEEEDRYIALLEKKLTSGKRSKNEPGYLKDIMDDGLGGE
jgi:hypothetical protein